ncbi:MAG: PhoU family transcriptional regulator [Methyloprofundus sp.]|nr:PhoU family transcriptional regulator [Methyloprofundus sp.]
MLVSEAQKLATIRQDMLELGRIALDINEAVLEKLEKNEISTLKELKLSSKKDWYNKIAAIDTKIIHLFALYTPEARDLRELVAFLKITNEFDRIINSSHSFMRDFPKILSAEVDQSFILEFAIPLQKTCVAALQNTLDMFDTDDKALVSELYKAVVVEENENDDMYKIIERNLLKKINKDLPLSREYQGVMSALRRLEKIADRALSIAVLMHYAKIGGEINKVKVSK